MAFIATQIDLPLDGSPISLTPSPSESGEHVWIRVNSSSSGISIGGSSVETTFVIFGRDQLVYLGFGAGELFARGPVAGSSPVRVYVLRRAGVTQEAEPNEVTV